MTDFAALIKQYAGTTAPIEAPLNPGYPAPVPVVEAKKESLVQAAEVKKQNLAGPAAYQAITSKRTGYGAGTLPEIQVDLANLSAADIYAKYGYERGNELINASAGASLAVGADSTTTRDVPQAVGDVAIDMASGFAGSLGAIGAVGLGMIDPATGVKASELLNQATKWGQDQQSDSLNARRRYSAAQNELAEKDTTAAYEASDKGLTANLAKIGRDVLNSVEIGASDSQTLVSGVAQGVGSMLGIGPVSKVIGAAGKAVLGAERAGSAIAKSAQTSLAIGAQTGGGAYTATVADALEALKDRTDLTQEQKIAMANDAALRAAAIAAPVGVAAGTLVSKFEGAPLAAATLRQAAGNVVRETVEEGIQSGASGVAQNIGIQSFVDPERDLNKDVGKAIGEGALYGAGTAGALGVPAVARTAASKTAEIAAKGLDAVIKRADRLLKKADEASPISEARVAQAASELGAVAPEAVATMTAAAEAEPDEAIKNTINNFANQISTFNSFDPTTLDPATPDTIKGALSSVSDKASAIQALAGVITDTANSATDKVAAATTMLSLIESFENLMNTNTDAMDAMSDDHPVLKIIDKYAAVGANINSSPAVIAAMAEVRKAAQTGTLVQATPENMGEEAVQATALVAQVAPEASNLESIKLVLKQASAGTIKITDRQRNALEAAAALMTAARDTAAKAKELGLEKFAPVNEQIFLDEKRTGEGQLSALLHVDRIRQAYDAKNLPKAKAYLEDMMLFAQHMQNKVAAINAHLESGRAYTQPEVYESLTADRKWVPSKRGMSVTPKNVTSVKFAQTVALEAERLGGIVNALVDGFPGLDVAKVPMVALDQRLQGKAEDVAKEFVDGKRAVVAKAPAQAPVAPVPASEPTPAPAPVVEPEAPVRAVSIAPVGKMTDEQLSAEAESLYDLSDATEQETARLEALSAEQEKRAAPTVAVESTPVAEPVKDVPTGFDNMKYSELSSLLESLEAKEPDDRTPKEQSSIDEIQSILDARMESARAKRQVEVKPEVVEETPVVSETGNVFEGLIPQSKLGEAFKYAKTQISRLAGIDSPLATLAGALTSTKSLEDFIGSKSKSLLTAETAKAYASYLDFGTSIKSNIKEAVAKFVKAKKVEAAFADESKTPPNQWQNGKILNIARLVDGKIELDDTLLETAVLAGLQWRIAALDRVAPLDDKDVAAALGISVDEVTPDLMSQFYGTIGHVEAVQAIAEKIVKYWGVQKNDTASISYQDGIPQAVAAQIFASLVDSGVVSTNTVSLTGPDGKVIRTVNRYTLNENEAIDPKLAEFPDAIEQAVAVEPEAVRYLGDAKPKIATTQMRNAFVENSAEALKAIEAEGNTPFYINAPLTDLYLALGLPTLMSFMGEQADPKTANVNHFKTLDGRNTNLASAYKAVENLMADLRNQADVAGVPHDQFAVRYAYNMSKVNRLQQLGAFGPQASKLVRELVLPTRSTLDLSKAGGDGFKAFGLALAQALGIKVHTQPIAVSNEKVFKLLENEYSGAVEVMQGWLKEYSADTEPRSLTQDELDTLKERLGSKFSPVAIHAVMEYARYKDMDAAGRKAFTTSLYVEADGVTNGPVNAMMLMSTQMFTPNWVNNIRKGGLFLGLPKMTMNEFRGLKGHEGHVDLYQTAAGNFKKNLISLRKTVDANYPDISPKVAAISSLMRTFLPEFITTDSDGNLEIDRGLVKNPLTVTIYGSGAAGISNKVVGLLLDSIYVRMTEANLKMLKNQGMSWAEAMFGAGNEAQAEAFNRDLYELTEQVAKSGPKGMYLKATPTSNKKMRKNPREFTLAPDEVKNLSENFQTLFVAPLRGAISDTLGADVFAGATLVQKTTQIQSVFMAEAFLKIVEEIKATKPKGEYVSPADLKTAMARLKAMHPMIQTAEQNYFVAGRDKRDDTSSTIAASVDERFRMNPSIYGPQDAGVSGIPYLIIGMGDGVMMQRLATMMGAPEGTLKVFDGMNMKLSSIFEDSQKANEAVFHSWQGNPFAAVSETYNAFLTNGDLTISDGMLEVLQRTFSNPDMDRDQAIEQMKRLGEQVKNAAKLSDIRREVLAEYNISVDQMATAASPFETKGTKQFSSSDPEVIAAELNEAYAGKLAALNNEAPSDEISGELSKAGRKQKDGTRLLVLSSLKKLAAEINIPADLEAVLAQALTNLVPKGYQVIVGTPAQLSTYATGTDEALKVISGVTRGWTDVESKTVYLPTGSAETLVHELVHASTIESVIDHYQGKLTGDQAAVTGLAVSNLEKLMAQFLNGEKTLLAAAGPKLVEAYNDAKAAILGFSQNTEMDPALAKAAALNEFMAWSLTNQNLATVLKTVKANPLVLLAEKAIALIKKFFFGRKAMPKAGKDVFSNILFNSAIVMKVQSQRGVVAAPTLTLNQNRVGDDARLTQIQEKFDSMVVDQMNLEQAAGIVANSPSVLAIQQAVELALDAQAAGFSMNQQQSTTLQSVVAALATQAVIDPASLNRAQALYTQVLKELTIQDFMVDPTSTDPNMEQEARRKYEWVVGKGLVKTDAQGRSSLLSAFMGMAIVSDDLRAVLNRIKPTKVGLKEWNTADNVIKNMGLSAMEKLSLTLSGTTKSKTVTEAIDALTNNIVALSDRQENMAVAATNAATGYVNELNTKIVEGLNALSDFAQDKADALAANNPNSRAAKAVQAAATLTGLLVNEDKADAVARGIMSGANRTNLVRPMLELMTDLVGRTSSNALIVDLVKKIRSVVQQDRQAYRENVPTIIASKFTRQLADKEWTALFNGMGKTDLASLVIANRNRADTIKLLVDDAARAAEIKRLEKLIPAQQVAKSKQLAEYMMTGKTGVNLLRNAYAISQGWNVAGATPTTLVAEIDQLVSLYALGNISAQDKVEISSLVQNEPEGLDFALAYLSGQREEENRKADANPMARANQYKGYIPSLQKAGVSLIVASDTEATNLRLRGYKRVGDYVGSSLERSFGKKGYYYSPVGGKATFTQGLFQNVNQTAGGVDVSTGMSLSGVAGATNDPVYIAKLVNRFKTEVDSAEPLMPVYDETGKIVSFERSIDPAQAGKLEKDTHLAKIIGVWRGRQVEEVKGQQMNYVVIDALKETYDNDIRTARSHQAEYVDLFGSKLDPVYKDAMKLMSKETLDYIESKFGDEFWVRKDMINDAIGYRAASVRDPWTGVTRWDPKTTKTVTRILNSFSVDAYKYLVQAENTLQNFIKDAKVLIVVKSVVVPVGNMASNIVHLMSRGVSPITMYRDMPRKTAEVNAYTKGRLRFIEAEAELLAANNNPMVVNKLKAEMKSIEDSYRRLSIWPLIEAGEFSAISDAGISREEILLTEGKLHAYMENALKKLPESLQTAGKYALVTKDTGLFQAMQKATEYGDFLAKAILYDHLIAQGKTKEETLGRVSEEFVNYDRLPGRFRGALESNGLLWFYNFKIRAVKVAASLIRNNPLQVLMAGFLPDIPGLGNVGTPLEDNLLTILAEGRITNSMGLGQAFAAPSLNPWFNMVN